MGKTAEFQAGKPVYATETTAPVANTTAGVYKFRPRPTIDRNVRCSRFRFTNNTGAVAYVKHNAAAASPFNWDDIVPSGAMIDDYTRLTNLTIWFATGATLQRVTGMPNGSGTAGTGSGTGTYCVEFWPEARDEQTMAE